MQDEYLTANEVAERLKLNVETVYDLMGSGQLPAVKIGGRWRMLASELGEWFQRKTRQAAIQEGSTSAALEKSR